jgi:hypothetical protein
MEFSRFRFVGTMGGVPTPMAAIMNARSGAIMTNFGGAGDLVPGGIAYNPGLGTANQASLAFGQLTQFSTTTITNIVTTTTVFTRNFNFMRNQNDYIRIR